MPKLDHYPLDSRMRDLGFTDHREGYWWKSWPLSLHDIFFSLTINKVTLEYEHIVIDEAFGQPYHYGRYLTGERLIDLVCEIEGKLRALEIAGFNIEFNHAEYCYQPQEVN